MNGALLGSAGVIVTLVTAVLGFWFGRKERTANAEATSVKTAIELNASLLLRVGKLEERGSKQDKELDRLQRRERIYGRLLIKHERWDADVVAALHANGIPMRPAPSMDIDDEPDPDGPRTRAEDYHGTRDQHDGPDDFDGPDRRA